MVRASMAVGVAVDIVVGSIPCEVSKPPLTPEVTSRKALCSLDDFLEVEMFINEGSYPATSDGQVESEDSAAFRPQEHHCSWSTMGSFDVYIMHRGATSF